jgi:uncharacterized protein (TIGR00297 family)
VPSPGAESLVQRLVLGAAAATGVVLAARRVRALSVDGALAAVAAGVASAVAGWDWALALIVFFLTGSAWSRAGHSGKKSRTAGVMSKGSERDAVQVAANGGVFALCAVGYVIWRSRTGLAVESSAATWAGPLFQVAAVGALAAAASDTWATEIGTLWGGSPRSILTGRPVAPGTSGGVTTIGTVGGIAGALCIGGLFWWLGWRGPIAVAGILGGVCGMGIDSLLGASLQSRRWCDRCNTGTERDVHDCASATRACGGLAWLDNDGVNALSTLAGAGIALGSYRWLIPLTSQ